MGKRNPINATDAVRAAGGYSQAIEVIEARRVLYISGQIPVAMDDSVPQSFCEQARLIWRNIEAQLKAADMSLENLVKVTTFLSDRQYAEDNADTRREVLGVHAPALTVLITEIFNSAWLLEIEAIAAA